MVVRLMNVENIDSYWKRVSQSLSLGDSFLRGKAEYDSVCSELGIQKGVLYAADRQARKHGLNPDIVSVLCQATGYCFPNRGHAEMAVIKEFITENKLNIPLDTFEVDAIEYNLYNMGNVVTPQLDELLRKYYSDDESVEEVNLVRFLQKYLNINREELKAVSAYEAGKTVGNIMDRAEYEYETSYRPLPNYVPIVVTQGVRDQIIKDLREFIEWEGSEVTGIYKCVW